jgi:hypothetical protein
MVKLCCSSCCSMTWRVQLTHCHERCGSVLSCFSPHSALTHCHKTVWLCGSFLSCLSLPQNSVAVRFCLSCLSTLHSLTPTNSVAVRFCPVLFEPSLCTHSLPQNSVAVRFCPVMFQPHSALHSLTATKQCGCAVLSCLVPACTRCCAAVRAALSHGKSPFGCLGQTAQTTSDSHRKSQFSFFAFKWVCSSFSHGCIARSLDNDFEREQRNNETKQIYAPDTGIHNRTRTHKHSI